MALRNNKSKSDNEKDKDYKISNDKSFKKQLSNINNLIGQANLSIYGTDRTSDVDTLNSKFQALLNDRIGNITKRNDEDITSFLSQIISSDNKQSAIDDLLNNQFSSMGGDYSSMQSFIYDAYRNRLLEQSDLHEVASQLIELSEAILITRDAIISADVVEGRMSRSFKFDNIDDDEIDNNTSIIENMEKKFKLLEKIKNFIIPKTLEYGEYYVYVVPYAKVFNDYMKSKERDGFSGRAYKEQTLVESFDDSLNKRIKTNKKDELTQFMESAYKKYTESITDDKEKSKVSLKTFTNDMTNILNNVSVCNESVPIPVLEEGFESIEYFKEFMDSVYTEADTDKKNNLFSDIAQAKITNDGITFDNKHSKKEGKGEFNEISDCYVKMLEPTKVLPIKIMSTTIGYYLIQDEDITKLSGVVSQNLYYTKFDEHRKEATIIDAIAERVVKSFDKPFLMNNQKFKETIVECIQYYNLNEKKIKFQFIPAEYIQEFKIDEDVDGDGTSMIKKSLFYAKLYLMLLLFKIMSIILNSNDTKVNYVKQSGIDKNLANKIQEIARIRQSRQINITDLFSYTTLINKVGNGSEMYIPTGRSGERPIETEILAGQDIQLNSDLLEMLKNAYILGTGVPAAIVNYMQEADFAKVIEQNNTKFNGRVVNYQLDFNKGITELYKKIMKWSTNIPPEVIDNFQFILQQPKSTTINTKSELINQFNTLADFLTQLLYDDPAQSMNPDLIDEIKEFKKLLAKDQLPMLNMEDVEELVEKAKLNMLEKRLKPNKNNGDNGDDDGLEEELNGIQV